MSKKVILTDIDGVVLQWQSNLVFFAAEFNLPTDEIIKMIIDEKYRDMSDLFNCSPEFGEQLLRKYNESKWIRGLKGYDDALIVINDMKDEYDFVGITALGKKFEVAANRISNLNVLFPNAFREVLICDHNESKDSLFDEAVSHYGDRIVCYIDDLEKHLLTANKILVEKHGLDIDLFKVDRRVGDTDSSFVRIQNLHDFKSFMEQK